ncbi:hypothetical protein GCM10023307_14230 [Lysobacter hankyongensis]|uniref:DUF7079 domain-containing protein n=2 Tax=Lysobacter hankyongensis TaxID=1176535 RepID=A0ABP9B422_9GAMM
MPMAVSRGDRDARIPVWIALSELYLDTDVSVFRDAIAETLAASPYSVDDLRDILMDDVHPALHANLMSVAGEWAGFDEAWLIERIETVGRQPRWRRRMSRWFARDIDAQWRALEPMILAARNAEPQR